MQKRFLSGLDIKEDVTAEKERKTSLKYRNTGRGVRCDKEWLHPKVSEPVQIKSPQGRKFLSQCKMDITLQNNAIQLA